MGQVKCRTCGNSYDESSVEECPSGRWLKCPDNVPPGDPDAVIGCGHIFREPHSNAEDTDPMIDCFNCGIFFDPDDPNNPDSVVDPAVVHKGRVVPGTKCRRCGAVSNSGRYCPRGCGPI